MSIKFNDAFDKSIEVSLFNNSNQTYILPIDTVDYKTYFSENSCNSFSLIKNYPDLGIIPIIYKNNDIVESMLDDKGMLMPENDFYKKNDEKNKIIKNKVLISWRKKLNIKNKEDSWILTNYYIYNHLVVLRPKQRIFFKKNFDYEKLNEYQDIYYYYYYPLSKNSVYKLLFRVCIDEKIYSYLTKKQKLFFKGKIFYKGIINSNPVVLKT